MLKQKLLALAISSLCISGAYAEVNQEEFTAGLVTASAEGIPCTVRSGSNAK